MLTTLDLFLYNQFIHFMRVGLLFLFRFNGQKEERADLGRIINWDKKDLEVRVCKPTVSLHFLQYHESQDRRTSFYSFPHQFWFSLWGLKSWYATQFGLVLLEKRFRLPCMFLSLSHLLSIRTHSMVTFYPPVVPSTYFFSPHAMFPLTLMIEPVCQWLCLSHAR